MSDPKKKPAAKNPPANVDVKSWEDRVVVLETQLTAALEQNAQLAELVKEQGGQMATLSKALEAHDAADKARKAKAEEDYISDLQKKATALQAPIPAEDLEDVKKAFASGNPDLGRKLGGALLSLAEAKGQEPEGDKSPLGKKAGADAQQTAEFTAGILKDMGYDAEAKEGRVSTKHKRISIAQ